MAQRILGLDIGSRSIKAVLLELGLRKFQVVGLEEVVLPPTGAAVDGGEGEGDPAPTDDDAAAARTLGSPTWLARLGEALGTLREKLGSSTHEACITAIPAPLVTIRQISLPFTRAREIEAVLGQEVEEYIPFRDIDEVVFDHLVLSQHGGVSQLLVAICPRSFLEGLLGALQQHGFDPRLVTAGGLSKSQLVRAVHADLAGPVAVVDIGHSCTNFTIVAQGKVLLWRTQMRGSLQLAQAIARAYSISAEQAEAPLIGEVEILPSSSALEYHPERVRLSELAKQALGPILRGLKQAMLAFSGIHDMEVREVYLCGGLSRLPGLERFFAAQLKLPVRQFDPGPMEWAAPLHGSDLLGSRGAEALSLALSALPQPGIVEVNFRKGSLAFQGGLQYFRGKVLAISVVLSMLLLGLGFYTYGVGRDLAIQERMLIADLKARTQVLLGEPLANPEVALARMRKTEKGGKAEGLPQQSAYDLLHDISRVIPAEVQVDFETLDIDLDRHRAEIRGKTTSATAVEQIVEALNQISCFRGGIEKDKNEKVGSEGKQLFVLSVKMGC
ncbi:MAG: hypothetical protein FJ125_04410 [Deltaproteobacteria bacterium]|nr:hypothetical protein [Deltaproteobacteria bacterium]